MTLSDQGDDDDYDDDDDDQYNDDDDDDDDNKRAEGLISHIGNSLKNGVRPRCRKPN